VTVKRRRFGHISRDYAVPKVALVHSAFVGGSANDVEIARTGSKVQMQQRGGMGALSSDARSRSRKRQMALRRTMESLETKLAVKAGSCQLWLVILTNNKRTLPAN
jgi:hypothetical protein